MTVQGNVGFSQKVRKVPKAERLEKTQRFIDLVGLTGFEKSFPVQLSGGMKQRVGIARAYCADPDVLLMDEPTSALDPISTSRMEDLVMELKEKYTIIMVTHNMQQAARISDRTVRRCVCIHGV